MEGGRLFCRLDDSARRIPGLGSAGAISFTLANRTGHQADEIHSGVGPPSQKRSRQRARLAARKTLCQSAGGAPGGSSQLIFPLGLWTGRYAAAAGEKLSSCCARCAWPSPRSTRCPPFFASGTRSSPDLQNHRDAAGGIPILKLTLMGAAPLWFSRVRVFLNSIRFSHWPIPIHPVFAHCALHMKEKPAPFTKIVKSAAPDFGNGPVCKKASFQRTGN